MIIIVSLIFLLTLQRPLFTQLYFIIKRYGSRKTWNAAAQLSRVVVARGGWLYLFFWGGGKQTVGVADSTEPPRIFRAHTFRCEISRKDFSGIFLKLWVKRCTLVRIVLKILHAKVQHLRIPQMPVPDSIKCQVENDWLPWVFLHATKANDRSTEGVVIKSQFAVRLWMIDRKVDIKVSDWVCTQLMRFRMCQIVVCPCTEKQNPEKFQHNVI